MPRLPPKAQPPAKSAKKDKRSTSRWQKCRDAYRGWFPVCQRCIYKEQTDVNSTKNLSVHHIKALETAKNETEEEDLLLDFDNLLTLCRSCHQVFNDLEKEYLWDQAEENGRIIKEFFIDE